MVKVGIVGLGFMGVTHLGIYRTLGDRALVTAVADPDPKKRGGDFSGAAGNIGVGAAQALTGVAAYESLDQLLAEADVDLVDITLPTYLHRDAVLKALRAGKHVVCEKPITLLYEDATVMVQAARDAGRQLYIGHCVRFWPAYVKARELIRGGELGPVRTAAFSRLSAIPGWVWQNWVFQQDRSGGAPLDLHIHDADYIAYTFGRPRAVSAFAGGRGGQGGPLDHIAACFHYDEDMLVTAVGAWEYASGYPFSMTFSVHMDGGTLALAADGRLTLYRDGQEGETLTIAEGDGWTHELRHFVECAQKSIPSNVITPEDAAFSVKLVQAELEAVRLGRRVEVE